MICETRTRRFYIAVTIDIGYKDTFALMVQQRYKDGRIKILHADVFHPMLGIKHKRDAILRVTQYIQDVLGPITSSSTMYQALRLVTVEEQLPYARKIIIQIEQHCLTFFTTIALAYNIPISVISVNSKLKYSLPNGPSGASTKIRKQWAADYLKRHLQWLEGMNIVSIRNRMRNDNDVAKNCGDAYIILEAALRILLTETDIITFFSS